jgi:hypothetical protein
MMRGSRLSACFLGFVSALIVTCPPLAARAADDGGCAREVLAPYLAQLQGWKINGLEAEGGGARIVLEQKGQPQYLLIALGLEGTKFHTFTTVHGNTGDSTVPEALANQLTPLWDRLAKDPAAQKCDRLNLAAAPEGDAWYKKLDALYKSLEPEPAHPLVNAGNAEIPGPAEEGNEVLIAVTAGFVLVAVALILVVLRRRRAPKPAAPATPPAAPAEPPPPDSGSTPEA